MAGLISTIINEAQQMRAWSDLPQANTALILFARHKKMTNPPMGPYATFVFRQEGSNLKMMVCFKHNKQHISEKVDITPLDDTRVKVGPTKVVNYTNISELAIEAFYAMSTYPDLNGNNFTLIPTSGYIS